MIGYITFRLAQRELACRLNDVREVVRLHELQTLPGLRAPVTGLLELRGIPLPVIDLRAAGEQAERAARGDVLVWTSDADPVGVAVDEVTGVLDEDELESTGDDPGAGLPSYVIEVMRRPGRASPVLLVDLRRLIKVAAA